MTDVAVVIATYNEAETIGEILRRLDGNWRVYIVDDNSPDGTAEIAREYENTDVLIRYAERGIASAYRTGFLRALSCEPDFVVQMDAGMTHKPEDADRLVDYAYSNEIDLLIASRFLDKYEHHGYRTSISTTAAAMMRSKGVMVTDATTGFRCWRAGLLANVADRKFRAHGFAFQLEALWRAYEHMAYIDEIPVEYALTNSSFKPSMLVEALKVYAWMK